METHLSFQGENGIYAEAVHALELGGWMEASSSSPSVSLVARRVTVSLILSGSSSVTLSPFKFLLIYDKQNLFKNE